MKKPFQILLTVIMFSAVLMACKKYEEDPNRTLRTVKARLTGTWEVTKYTDTYRGDDLLVLDSADIWIINDCGDSSYYSDLAFRTIEVEFKRNNEIDIEEYVYGDTLDREATKINCVPVYTPTEETRNCIGEWEFGDGKDILIMPMIASCAFHDESYQIIKLTKSEMKLLHLGHLTEVELTKKKN